MFLFDVSHEHMAQVLGHVADTLCPPGAGGATEGAGAGVRLSPMSVGRLHQVLRTLHRFLAACAPVADDAADVDHSTRDDPEEQEEEQEEQQSGDRSHVQVLCDSLSLTPNHDSFASIECPRVTATCTVPVSLSSQRLGRFEARC
jgi:hypothetical protein